MKRIGYRVVALLLVSGLLLSACRAPTGPVQAPESKPAVPVPAATGPTTSSVQDAARKEGKVVLWSHSFQDRDEFVQFFKTKYPYIDLEIWSPDSSELINRALSEAKVGRVSADLFTLSEKDMPLIKDLLTQYDWPTTRTWNQALRPSHNLWLYYGLSAKLPAYNTDVVPAADAPKSMDDLKDVKWRNRVVNSTSNTEMPLVYAYKWGQDGNLNWDKSFAYWTQVFDNTRPRMSQGFQGAMGMLAAGEVGLHQMTSIPAYFQYVWRGAPLALAPLKDEVPANGWLVGMMKNPPHPNAAKLFAGLFTSPEAQVILSNKQGFIASSPEAAQRTRINLALAEKGLKTFTIPPELYTAENLKKTSDFWTKLMGVR